MMLWDLIRWWDGIIPIGFVTIDGTKMDIVTDYMRERRKERERD